MLKTVSSITNAIGALNYKGTWDANANSPTIVSSVGTKGDYYVVSVAGSTTINSESLWGVGDWIVFNDSIWQKIDGGDTGNFTTITASTSGLIGTSTASFSTGTLQVWNTANTNILAQKSVATNAAPWVFLLKSRGTTPSSSVIVQNNDGTGIIGFLGDDGASSIPSAYISGYVDGVPSANVMPGRLSFLTNGGSNAVTERMRISSTGNTTFLPDGTNTVGTFSSTGLAVTGTLSATGTLSSTGANNLCTASAGTGVTTIGSTTGSATQVVLVQGNNASGTRIDISNLATNGRRIGVASNMDGNGNLNVYDYTLGGYLYSVGAGKTLSLEGATPQTGTGVTFPVTQSASTDANTLDDYEEGTWTPSPTGLTVVGTPTYAGKYTKIGNCVTAMMTAQATTSTASTAGSTYFSGLPFAPVIYASTSINNANNQTSIGCGSINSGLSRYYTPTYSSGANEIIVSSFTYYV